MTELIFANPKKRTSRKGKMPAALKRYWASRRGTKRAARKTTRRSSRKRSSTARGVTVVTVNRNPAPAVRKSIRPRSNSFKRAGSRFGSKLGNLVPSTLLPAAIGAGGALAIDMAWGYLPIPDTIKTGPLAPLARLGLAVGLGVMAGRFAGKKFGNEVMVGAATVTAYDLTKAWLQANTQVQLSMYDRSTMGMFDTGLGRLGYRSPAMIAGRLGSYQSNIIDYDQVEAAQDSFD